MHARVRIPVYLDLIESTRVHIFLASRGRDIKRETKEKKTSSFGLKQVIGVRALIPFFFAPLCLCLATWVCLTARPQSVGAWVACCQRVEKNTGSGHCTNTAAVDTMGSNVPNGGSCARTVPSGRGFHRNPHAIPAFYCNN